MDCSIVTVERQLTAVIKTKVPFDKIPEAQHSARTRLAGVLPSLDIGTPGAGCTRFLTPPKDGLDMEIGCIVTCRFQDHDDVVMSDLPAGRAAHFALKGPFDGLPRAWQTLFDWGVRQGLTFAGINWEIYGATQDAELYALLA